MTVVDVPPFPMIPISCSSAAALRAPFAIVDGGILTLYGKVTGLLD